MESLQIVRLSVIRAISHLLESAQAQCLISKYFTKIVEFLDDENPRIVVSTMLLIEKILKSIHIHVPSNLKGLYLHDNFNSSRLLDSLIKKMVIVDVKSPASLAEISTSSIIENFGLHEEYINKLPTILYDKLVERKLMLDDANFESWLQFHKRVEHKKTISIEPFSTRSKAIELLEVLSRRTDASSFIYQQLASDNILNEPQLEAYLCAFEVVSSNQQFPSTHAATRYKIIQKILDAFKVHLCCLLSHTVVS